jgi:membrane protein implicated in regulation of membrane protease activity
MIQTIVHSFIFGALVFVATALIFNKDKATRLPAGAIIAAFVLAPWWMALICSLVGHFGTAFLVKKFF